jgi:YidC/Oxa1 family membrane protein insertase
MRPWLQIDGSVDYADDLEALESPEKVDGQADWFGLADTYFASLVLVGEADAPGDGYLTYSRRLSADGAALHGVQYTQDLRLAPGATQSETFRVYLGPKSMEQLEAYDPRLGGAIDLGVLSFFAVVLMHMLKAVHAVVGDWALAIIGLTFLIKAAFFPLTQQSFRSQRAMQVIQPEMKKIQEEYKDNPEELQRRMVELFREAGVNPASGCIPMIVQMPVWFALYSVLLSAVELYHAKFLYLEDLTQPDPYLALPTLVMGLMFLQQRMMPTANMDPAQARLMKLMPLIFGFLFFMFPAGLALYVFVNMLLSIVQQWYIKRTFNSAEPAGAATGA